MKYQRLHAWNVRPKEAILIQKRLVKKIVLDTALSSVNKIAAGDTGSASEKEKIVAAVAVFSFPQLELLEKNIITASVDFPYIPGLLTFREGPVLLKAFAALKSKPDLAIFDGQGIAHPRRMGLATHMGILLELPTIGCAKTALFGDFSQPLNFKGAYSHIRDKDKKIIGVALRTRQNVRCVFVSSGYKINLKSAREIILACSPKFRIPEPLRAVHNLTRIYKR